MYYIIIENKQIISVLNYEPAVPEDTLVFPVTDEQYVSITETKSHYFDTDTLSIVAHTQERISQAAQQKLQETINAENTEFLQITDWKILRHIREQALNISTSLSDEEYLALEESRETAARLIVKTDKYTGTSE